VVENRNLFIPPFIQRTC